MKVSKHFSASEFVCKCGKCGEYFPNWELLCVLERIRTHYKRIYGNAYVYITSGLRCIQHNATIPGAASNSKHMYGIACDFKVFVMFPEGRGQVDSDEVCELLCRWYTDKYGIGKYKGRTHLDVRPEKARW